MKVRKILFLLMAALFLVAFINKNANKKKELLIGKTWKVYEVEVAGYSYKDSVSTGIKYTFHKNGTCHLETHQESTSLDWTMDNAESKIIFNPGTPDELIYYIVDLSNNSFSYNVNLDIDGKNYLYTYKLKPF